MVADGSDGSKIVDTIEELQVHSRGYAQSNDALRRARPLKELPSGLMDPTHRGKIQRWLIEIKEYRRGSFRSVKTAVESATITSLV